MSEESVQNQQQVVKMKGLIYIRTYCIRQEAWAGVVGGGATVSATTAGASAAAKWPGGGGTGAGSTALGPKRRTH